MRGALHAACELGVGDESLALVCIVFLMLSHRLISRLVGWLDVVLASPCQTLSAVLVWRALCAR